MTEKKTKGEVWLEAGSFGWFVQYEFSDHWLDFKAYECVGEECSPQAGRKLFLKDGWVSSAEHAETMADAEVTLDGFVKWDGCCEVDGPKPHFCGADDVATRGVVLRKLHSLCLLIPRVDYGCAGYPEGAQFDPCSTRAEGSSG